MSTTFAERIMPELIKEAAERGTPVESLIEVIVSSLLAAYPLPRSKFELAGVGGRLQLLSREGGCMGTSDAALAYQGHNPDKEPKLETVRRAAREHRLVSVRDGHGDLLFPKWQFSPDGGVLPGLPQVLAVLTKRPGYSDITPFIFFLQPHPVTKDTPLVALRENRLDDVLKAARSELE